MVRREIGGTRDEDVFKPVTAQGCNADDCSNTPTLTKYGANFAQDVARTEWWPTEEQRSACNASPPELVSDDGAFTVKPYLESGNAEFSIYVQTYAGQWLGCLNCISSNAATLPVQSACAPTPTPTPTASTTVQVILTQPWTGTGIILTKGQLVAITASGSMNYWTGGCQTPWPGFPGCMVSPAGIPAPGPSGGHGVPAPGLADVSLIGRIGSGAPFEVGIGLTFTAQTGGELFLGVNDVYFADNTGSWIAVVSLTSP
jgi:hypothetical protein